MVTTSVKTKPPGEPLFEVCKVEVKKPTLIREDRTGIGVWLQWYGESDSFDLSDKQFLFPVNTDPGNFFFQPQSFEIIMVGPVKNWNLLSEDKNVVDEMIRQAGGADTQIIYFISPKFGVSDGAGGTMPAAGVLPLDIQLADDNCGIIKPKEFFDDSVRINAVKTFQAEH